MPKVPPPKTVYKVARLYYEDDSGEMTFCPFEDPCIDGKINMARSITDHAEAWSLADARALETGQPHGVFALIDVRRPVMGIAGSMTADALSPNSNIRQFVPPTGKRNT